jgi:putative ATP-dependent endonuclease of the OLD family
VRGEEGNEWIKRLERHGVFFSEPLDLDFSMLQSFLDAYEVTAGSDDSPRRSSSQQYWELLAPMSPMK